MIQQFLMTALLVNAPSSAQEAPSFSGRWERDPERSDDAREKMQAAMQEMREKMAQRGGMRPGGGMPPAGGTRAGGPGGGRQPQMGGIPESFSAELADNELHIDDGERVQIYYLDGEKHMRQSPNGMELETVSDMRGRAVHIEEKARRGEMQRVFELSGRRADDDDDVDAENGWHEGPGRHPDRLPENRRRLWLLREQNSLGVGPLRVAFFTRLLWLPSWQLLPLPLRERASRLP